MSNEAEAKASKALIQIRNCGRPSTRDDWKVVLVTLMRCSDEILEQLRDNCRQYGVGWLHPVVDKLLNAIAKKQAYRDANGMLLFREPPDRIFSGLFDPSAN